MRRSSAREAATAGRDSDRSRAGPRAQTEPFAALAAVVVVALALSVWAGAFEESLPEPVDRDLAEPTADRVERALTVGGIVRPARLSRNESTGTPSPVVNRSAPEGYRLNVSIVGNGGRQSVGPAAPSTAEAATRRIGVGRPGSVSPARLEVRVWT
jgi:hypothetical protein